jgi:hypothetical protein
MERNEVPHDPRHLGVPSGASKTISKPMVRLAQTVHLPYVKISTISKRDRNDILVEHRNLGVPYGVSNTISEPKVLLAQTVHLSCTDTNSISKRTEMRFHGTHVTEEFHQVRHKWFLSPWYFRCIPCTYFPSKLALSPNGPKLDSIGPTSPRSLSYFCSKRCTYLVSILALYLNRPKQASS